MKKKVFIFWSILIAAAVTRLVFSLYEKPPVIGGCLGKSSVGQGTISDEPTLTNTGQVLVVLVSSIHDMNGNACPDGLLVRMKTKAYPQFAYGDSIQWSGTINKPFNFNGGTGRSFDFEGYLAKDDIYYEIKSAMISEIDLPPVRAGPLGLVTYWLYKIKSGFVSHLNQTLGEPHAALAAGLVVGEKSSLGKDLLNDFRIVGLIHIVVLSGFNITVVGDAMRKVLSFLPRIWSITAGAIGIVLFGILVGGGATVVRSCFMACIALSADLFRRDYNVVRALMFAALLMLIQNPHILLHDPSFQLSFLATLGLILLAAPIEKRLKFVPKKVEWLRAIIASTFATQIFVSPYILYMMGQLSIIGVVVNILVLPFIPVTMLFVFLTGASGFVSIWIAQLFGYVSHILLGYELFMVEHFARLPLAAIQIPQFSLWYVIGFYIVFAIVYCLPALPNRFSITSQLRLAKKSST